MQIYSSYLQAHNNTLLTGCDYSRLEQFEAIEKNVLKPLNKYPYDPMTTKAATVGKTGFVTVEQRYYSVPYKFIGGEGKADVQPYKGRSIHGARTGRGPCSSLW